MKILFQLPYPGYLRVYGSTLRELAARDHEIALAYDSVKRRDPTADEIEGLAGVTVIARVPDRRGRLTPFVDRLRLGADYARYLDPRFADAQGLRRRMDKYLPKTLAWLARAPTLPGPLVRGGLAAARATERALPAPPQIESYLSSHAPDCVVVSPGLGRGARATRQADTFLAARRLGIPAALAVTSWDHLTSKGVIHGDPDVVLLWNEAQRREAMELHGVPSDRIEVTGAQLFDQWFALQPQVDRAQFVTGLGLPADGPYVLYVGSSANIAPFERELTFVRRWLTALREAQDVSVLIRPHPGNVDRWADVDLSEFGAVAIAPRERPHIPMGAADEALYFHSLHYSAAVVGVNTSAMIEAAIVGRPVHTLRAPEFADTQEGTLHFRLLVDPDAPAVRMADGLDEHLAQVADAIARPDAQRERAERFVRSFVRPHGLERPATPIVADAIEALARSAPSGDLATYVHPVPSTRMRKMVRKRRRAVLAHVARSALRPEARDERKVRTIYEGHYSSDNGAYARSRDKRRDVFVLDGTPVYTDGWFTIRFHADLLVEALDEIGAHSVLEVGSGRGTNLAQLALRRPELELSGLELTSAGVERARQLLADPPPQHLSAAGLRALDAEHRAALDRVAVHEASALEMPFEDDSFDVSFTVLVLEQLASGWPQVLSEMRRVTRSCCIFLEPFSDANGPVGRAYLRSLDYFRASHRDFRAHGLEPVRFTTDIPQKLHFRTGFLVARVAEPHADRTPAGAVQEPARS